MPPRSRTFGDFFSSGPLPWVGLPAFSGLVLAGWLLGDAALPRLPADFAGAPVGGWLFASCTGPGFFTAGAPVGG